MDDQRARALLDAERVRVEGLLSDLAGEAAGDRSSADEPGDLTDSAEPLTSQGLDDAVAAGLRDRLAALERAEARLEEGTYGRSVRSGQPIPDARLEADPAAELTVQEAEQA
jgi:DnaK suppressor protein